MDNQEINNLLDAIKMMTGEYRARGEEMDIGENIHSREFYQNTGKMKPYEANLSREEAYNLFDALRKMPAYRPIEEDVGSPEYDQEIMRRYKQFFGFK